MVRPLRRFSSSSSHFGKDILFNSAVFQPEQLINMGAALDELCQRMGRITRGDDVQEKECGEQRERLALAIIEAATKGIDDVDALTLFASRAIPMLRTRAERQDNGRSLADHRGRQNGGHLPQPFLAGRGEWQTPKPLFF